MERNFYPVCGDDYCEEIYTKEVKQNEVLSASKTATLEKVAPIQKCSKCSRQVMPNESRVQLMERVYHSGCLQKQVSSWIGR